MSLDDVYDEFLSTSDDEFLTDDDDDSSYDPSPISKLSYNGNKQDVEQSASQKLLSILDKENEDPVDCAIKAFRESRDAKKLTVELCKGYLRKYGLQVTGAKEVLVGRIAEHMRSEGGKYFENSNRMQNISESSNVDAELAQIFVKTCIGEKGKSVTIDQCKCYLRKHGLRLTGTKAVLIERIKNHVQLQDESGIIRYPEATFTKNCQGDACVGDVVLFKQRVYDKFNIDGRCSIGPPLGLRTIAGRIIKESYGSAKQQHTFTVEVLWSTGVRPLPALHPLIIKGRNLYRVKTLRQPWPDEDERKRELDEKHSRGDIARFERRMRIEVKKRFDSGRKCTHINRFVSSSAQHTLMHTMQALKVDATPTHRVETALQLSNNRKDKDKTHSSSITEAAVDKWSHTESTESVASINLRLNSNLAGLIIGKQGVNSKEIIHASKADLRVKRDPFDTSLCIVEIRGTSLQRNMALKMVGNKINCRFFAQGICRHGGSCKFSHSLVGYDNSSTISFPGI